MAIEAYKYFLNVTNDRPNNTESPSHVSQTQKLAQIGQKRKMMTPKAPTQKVPKMAQPTVPSSPPTELFQRILQAPPPTQTMTSSSEPAHASFQPEAVSFSEANSTAEDKKSQILENLAAESDGDDNVMVIQPENDSRIDEPEDETEEDIEEVIQFDSSMGVKSEVNDRSGQGTHTMRKILPINLTLNDLIMTTDDKSQGNTDGSSIPLNLDGWDTPDTFNEVEQIINPIDPAIIAQRLRVSRWDWLNMRRRVLRNCYVLLRSFLTRGVI